MAHEERPCFSCDGGTILVCKRPMEPPKRKPCPKCQGTGKTWAFLYPKVSPDLRRADSHELMWLAWNGTVRERKAAEREIDRRHGDAR